MPYCPGCSVQFAHLDPGVLCSKCQKKSTTPQSEWKTIDSEPACKGCGVTWQFLAGDYCGSCKNYLTGPARSMTQPFGSTGGTAGSLAVQLSSAADAKEKEASSTRLHQRKPGVYQAERNKIDLLRQANRSTPAAINIETILYYWPKGGKGNAKRVQMDAFWDKVNVSDSAESTIHGLLTAAKLKYAVVLSAAPGSTSQLDFSREKANFSIVRGSSNHSIDAYDLQDLTVDEMVAKLKEDNLITSKFDKDRKLTLRATVWESEMDEFDDDTSTTQPRWKLVGKSARRPQGAETSIVKRSSKRKHIEDLDILPLPRTSSSRRSRSMTYESGWRGLKTTFDESLSFTYETFTFYRMEYQIDNDGTTTLLENKSLETIDIVDGWQLYKSGGKPAGGYLSKGFSKYAFRGLFNGKEYAIFQLNYAAGSNFDNTADLLSELKLLVLGQYFMERFYERAYKFRHRDILPNMSWNTTGAFVGKLSIHMEKMGQALPETANLYFTHFLAAPLLAISHKLNKEIKFGGNTDTINSERGVPGAIAAFVHATLVHSYGEVLFSDIQGLVFPGKFPYQDVILFDPQAHTIDKSSGPWDHGRQQIEKYMSEHSCNLFCSYLRLPDLQDISLDSLKLGDGSEHGSGSSDELDEVDELEGGEDT